MKEFDSDNLFFTWWNTSLAPSAKTRANANQRNVVYDIINFMINTLNIDFIALGEVSEIDITNIKLNCNLNNHMVVSGIDKAGRSSFDTCYIYNSKKIEFIGYMNSVIKKNRKTYRLAQKVDIKVVSTDTLMHLFISHWPSRLHYPKDDPERHQWGIRLRMIIDEISSLYDNNPYIICMGDYNDEPFDTSIAEHLMATRDRDLVIQRKALFYNPFWRQLGYTRNKNETELEQSSCGSYYYKNGSITKWHTFDQIMFSHSFIKYDKWRLDDESANILCLPGLLDIIKDPNEIFDHLPIITKIERVV